MTVLLNPVQARLLGALIEKEITTPEYYPLSLNAIMTACNQKSNREPVMNLDEDDVRQALHALEDLGLAGPSRSTDGRVAKYEHLMQEAFNLSRAETAVLCLLLLRGPQTPGELRGRTERMYHFDQLGDVQSAVDRLIEHDPPLAKILSRQAGTKEPRTIHLLSGEPENMDAAQPAAGAREDKERLPQLEAEVARLREEVAELRQKVGDLLKTSNPTEDAMSQGDSAGRDEEGAAQPTEITAG